MPGSCVKNAINIHFPHERRDIKFNSAQEARGIEIYIRARRKMSSQKWTISLLKQGKYKVGVVPADYKNYFFVFIIVLHITIVYIIVFCIY
jgi:hypothetical protein